MRRIPSLQIHCLKMFIFCFCLAQATTATTERIRPKRQQGCPPLLQKLFCFNGGNCLAHLDQQNLVDLSCRCANGFHGHRCQHIFDASIYFDSAGLDRFQKRQFVPSHLLSLLIGCAFAFCTFGFVIYRRKRLKCPPQNPPIVHL